MELPFTCDLCKQKTGGLAGIGGCGISICGMCEGVIAMATEHQTRNFNRQEAMLSAAMSVMRQMSHATERDVDCNMAVQELGVTLWNVADLLDPGGGDEAEE